MKVACRIEDGDEVDGAWAWVVVVGVKEVRVARVGAWREGSFPMVCLVLCGGPSLSDKRKFRN